MQGQMHAVWRKIRNHAAPGGGFHGILTLHIPVFPRILMDILKPPRKGANVMLKSIYLQQVYSDLAARDPEQKEFHQAVREVLESLEQRTVHTSGLAHLLELPEYRSLERAQPLMSYLSEDADPARFPVPKDDPMKILIGPENVADALKDTSVVVASYDIGDGMRGVIGVVGPTRMDYAKITARLSYLAEGLSRLFGQGELPQGRDDEK